MFQTLSNSKTSIKAQEPPGGGDRYRHDLTTKVRVNNESDDEEPPPCTDGWLPVIVNSPTSPAEEENKETVRSPSFEPDFSGEEAPEIVPEREDQTSPSKKASSGNQMFVDLLEPWGNLSWYVDYPGPYDNSRPRHVELRTQDEFDRGVENTLYHTMQPGTVCKLEEIHYLKNAVAWFVGKLVKGEEKVRVHFTVHVGDRQIGDFIPASDDDSRVRDYRAEKEVEDRLKREEEESFPLNQSLEVLRTRYGEKQHYGPSRIGMFQVRKMLKKTGRKYQLQGV